MGLLIYLGLFILSRVRCFVKEVDGMQLSGNYCVMVGNCDFI
jgi:hypothetical protein